MEVIKELPEVFEEFAEQRKNSFLAVKELKDKGNSVREIAKILGISKSKVGRLV